MIKSVHWRRRFEWLTPDELAHVHQASLAILARTGLQVPLTGERRDQARDLGLRFDPATRRLTFPPEVVERALAAAPPRYQLAARDPAHDLLLDGEHGYLSLDGCGTDVLDPETGAIRPSTKRDLERAVLLADALPEVAFLWPCLSARDQAPRSQPLHELEAMLTCSTKHAQAMTVVDPATARAAVAIAAAVAGGPAELRQRPLISSFQCSVSPLCYEEGPLEAAFVFAAAGIPTGFMNMTIGCGTAPATTAGNLALGNAEVLGGITLLELCFPGTPTFYGSCATAMELRRGGITSGGPEDFLLQAATCQLARHYRLPACVGTFATGAKASTWQAGVENALSSLVSQLAGADMMCGAGLLGGARVFSCEQLVLDCEIFDLCRATTEGFAVDDDTLALEVVHAVGPQGHFMTHPHTRAHLRGGWQPTVMERDSFEEWERRGRQGALEKARERARRLLEKHEVPELPGLEAVREIIDAHERG